MTIRRIGVICICLGLAVAAVVPLLRASAPASPSASPSAANKPGGKTPQALMDAVGALDEKITDVMPTPKLLTDAAFRGGDGQKALPLLKEAVGVMAELEKAILADPKLKDAQDLVDEVHVGRFHAMAYAATLGDKDVTGELTALAKEKSADGIIAKSALTLSQWMLSSKDAEVQQKILDEMTATAKENPTNTEVTSTLAVMINLGAANTDMEKKIIEVIRANMKGEMVTQLLAQLDGEQEQKAMVGKALAVAGRTSTGSSFDTTSLKGKVIMLDFWATWCGPCIAELPHVKQTYAAYHDKGFEIVGLSCDDNDQVLNNFIKDKEMPWMQLRESTQTEPTAEKPNANWHPLATKFHVDGIPTMFLIDRNGVLRYVDAREDLDKKVAKLLAEPVTASQPAGAK